MIWKYIEAHLAGYREAPEHYLAELDRIAVSWHAGDCERQAAWLSAFLIREGEVRP